MSNLKRLAIGLALLLGLVVAISFSLPVTINVARDIEIDASEQEIFPHLANLSRFKNWSPWAFDPDTQYDFSGPKTGEGAKMAWKSQHPDVGSGTMTIIRANAPDEIDVALDFGGQGQGTSQFRLSPIRTGTRVIWRFRTKMGENPINRWMGLLIHRAVDAKYQEGLKKLKKVVENSR